MPTCTSSASPERSGEDKIRETLKAGKATAKHPSHTSRAEPPPQESTWRTKVSQTFSQPTAAPGEKRREKRGEKKPQTNPNQLRKWRRKDAKELQAPSRVPRGAGGSSVPPGAPAPLWARPGPPRCSPGRASASPAPRPPGPAAPSSGRSRGDFCPQRGELFRGSWGSLLRRPHSPGGAPSPPHRGEPNGARANRTAPERTDGTGPEPPAPCGAAPDRGAPSSAEPSPAQPQLPEPRGAGAGPVPERSRGSRRAGGAALGKVPLGPAPSRQEIPPRHGLIGKARRVVRRGRAGAAVTHRDAASSGAGAGPPIPPHRHRSAPGWCCPGLPGIGSL